MALRPRLLADDSLFPGSCHGCTYHRSEKSQRTCHPDRFSRCGIHHLASLLFLKIFLGQAERLTSSTGSQNDSTKQHANQSALHPANQHQAQQAHSVIHSGLERRPHVCSGHMIPKMSCPTKGFAGSDSPNIRASLPLKGQTSQSEARGFFSRHSSSFLLLPHSSMRHFPAFPFTEV
jgi:hypothetical protein